MYKIDLGNEPKQEITVMLDDNTRIPLTFEYRPNQIGWLFRFEYNNNKYKNIRCTTSFNILRAYRNWLPFGLRCDTQDSLEPMDLTDFSSGYATIYVLTPEDVNTTESIYYAKVSA